MKTRYDLLPSDSKSGLEVIQLTERSLPSSHIYMEAQIFTPDSKRFLLHESAAAHGSSKDDPHHRYLLCDLDDNCALHPITNETGATAPSLSPDGSLLYYFVNETVLNGGRLSLKRVRLDGSDRQTLLVLDAGIPGTAFRPSMIYPLSTIRSDGKSIALSCFLGDGTSEGATWGLMVFDIEKQSVSLILEGKSWCNIHPQYCRAKDAPANRGILVQENHGNSCSPDGQFIKLTGGNGADIHLINDDGTDFRDLPWGRDGNEFCQGHQCWRGTTSWAITSTGTREPAEHQLIESKAVPYANHIGTASPGGIRNHLSRDYPKPSFCHFATDADGRRLVTDSSDAEDGRRLFVADLNRPGSDALSSWTCIARPNSSWSKNSHVHPFLAPDGNMAFFNSDESGILQAYMVRGLDALQQK